MKNLSFLFIVCALFFSCKSPPVKNIEKIEPAEDEKISFLFLGDIMAHKPNFSMKDYDKIWADVKPIIQKCDISFANIETPVDDTKDFSSFPNFNIKNDYAKAFLDAGINVFSLANNHTNDQGVSGIKNTLLWAKKIKENQNNIYFSGINEKENSPISYEIINHDGWKIIFFAVTEILNHPDGKEYINFVKYSESGRKKIIQFVKNLKETENPDLIILSIHTDEPEYIQKVSESRKKYYHELLKNGADVIWANHPHVIRERELIIDSQTQKTKKIILYGNGNTISGQRWDPDFKNPKNPRDYTGDGLMFFAEFSKNPLTKEIFISQTKPYFITTYINTAWNFVIKMLDDDFINYLEENKRSEWASYIQKRKEISEKTKENIVWQ